jgi:hypothetical protein
MALRVEFWLQVAEVVQVRMPRLVAVANSLDKLQLVGAMQVLLEARSQPVMHLVLAVMEQPMLVVAVAVIGVVEVVAHMAVAAAGLHTLMQVYSAWCTRRRILWRLQMGHSKFHCRKLQQCQLLHRSQEPHGRERLNLRGMRQLLMT